MDILRLPLPSSNGLTLDSIYVVAFYTDKISVSGGPESFGCLSGMILQVAFTHENVSLIATKVDYLTSPMNSISPLTDGL
jgi:GLPGLI family protein